MPTETSSVTTRNTGVSALVESFFAKHAEATSDSKLDDRLHVIFSTPVWGYREILLVMTVGKILNSKYKPSVGFYACNPSHSWVSCAFTIPANTGLSVNTGVLAFNREF